MQRKKRTRTDDVPVWRSPGIPSLGLDPKTQSSRSRRDLLSSANASRRGEAEWPTRRDIWAEGSQVDFISAPFKSNLIGVGWSGRSCEGGGKKGRRGRIWKLLNVLFIWEWLLGGKLEDRSPDFLFLPPHPTLFLFFQTVCSPCLRMTLPREQKRVQLFFNLVPRKRLVKRLKEAARALIKTLLFKATLRRWEATTRGMFRSLRLPLVGVASSRRLPPPSPSPSALRSFVTRQNERTFDGCSPRGRVAFGF